MLTELTLKNYRAFHQQRFRLSKLNIFVGPNNSGKSAAVSSLNLIAQTLHDNAAGAPLVLRGNHDDLGTYHDVVYGNKANRNIGLGLTHGQYHTYFEFSYRSVRREIEVSKYELNIKNEPTYSYVARKDAYDLEYFGQKSESFFQSSKTRPDIGGFQVRDRQLFELTMGRRTVDIAGDKSDLAKRLQDLERQVRHAGFHLMDVFGNFESISPFRDAPKRTYLFSGASPTTVGRTGANTIDILVSDAFRRGGEKKGLVEAVSQWFQNNGIARSVKVKPLTSRHFEVCIIGNDGSEHNLCDVGFGCSQVLPVLVGGINLIGRRRRSRLSQRFAGIFVVQEPEIHLHPNAQADLGSVFVDLARNGVQLFVETHSDNLVLRVQKHVALGELAPDDVTIYFIRDEKGEKVVQSIPIDEQGMFKSEWPGGFFPQRQIESLELARAALQKEEKQEVLNLGG
jgi:predicted ATPase